jgi:hypothetical protein
MSGVKHDHGPCVRCGVEARKTEEALRVLKAGVKLIDEWLQVPVMPLALKIWRGQAHRAAKGIQMKFDQLYLRR